MTTANGLLLLSTLSRQLTSSPSPRLFSTPTTSTSTQTKISTVAANGCAGVTLDYEIVENLTTKVTVNYISQDHDDGDEDEDGVTGFFRLQRSF